MPKTKKIIKNEVEKEEEKDETKEILLDDEDKVSDPELIVGDVMTDDEDEEVILDDDEEVDPFKDRWEE